MECSVLFSFFVNELNEGVERYLHLWMTKLKGLDNILKERKGVQKDLNRLKQWTEINGKAFNRNQFILHLTRKIKSRLRGWGKLSLAVVHTKRICVSL